MKNFSFSQYNKQKEIRITKEQWKAIKLLYESRTHEK